MVRHTRATTVVSQPSRFSIASASVRLKRNHASCTASSASLDDARIRKATARSRPRCASNRCASAFSSIGHIFPSRSVISMTTAKNAM
jgi:hypothetical protein